MARPLQLEELVVLLDENNQPRGVARKSSVHGANTPYHLAFSCYIFNADNELLMTRRAWTKLTWPGIWTNSCCGHPAPGEHAASAVRRRVSFELGLAVRDLRLALPAFSYRAELGGIVEHEFCPVYLARVDTEPEPHPAEVAETMWTSFDEFAGRSDISPWAVLQVRELEPLVEPYLSSTRRLTVSAAASD